MPSAARSPTFERWLRPSIRLVYELACIRDAANVTEVSALWRQFSSCMKFGHRCSHVFFIATRSLRLNQHRMYTVFGKKKPLHFWLFVKMLTSFQTAFTNRLRSKFVTKQWLHFPSHLKCVTTLPCQKSVLKNRHVPKLSEAL